MSHTRSNQPEKVLFDSSPTVDRRPGPGRYQSTRSNDRPGTVRAPVLLCELCLLTFQTPDALHHHLRSLHFECGNCSSRNGTPRSSYHKSAQALHKHIRSAHPHRWCHLCHAQISDHSPHYHCPLCNLLVAASLAHHLRHAHLPKKPGGRFYDLLDVSPSASGAEIRKAARNARVNAHPDRHLRAGASGEGGSSSVAGAGGSSVAGVHSGLESAAAARTRLVNERAMEVGRAADVLCNADARRQYDLDVRRGRSM